MSQMKQKAQKASSRVETHNTTASDLIEFARSVAEQELRAQISAGREADSNDHDRVVGIQRGFVLVLAHHKAPRNVIRGFVSCSYSYLLADESTFFKRAKFLSAYFMARYLRNELPEAPPGSVFRMTGDFRRWIRARLTKFSKQNTHLFFSLFQTKRSALPATNEVILGNAMKHREAMVKPGTITDDLVSDLIETIRPLLNVVKKRLEVDMDRPLEMQRLLPIGIDSVHQASLSASVESNRRQGGQAGSLFRQLEFGGRVRKSAKLTAPFHSGFAVEEDIDTPVCEGIEIDAETPVAGIEFLDSLVDVLPEGSTLDDWMATEEAAARIRRGGRSAIEPILREFLPFTTRLDETSVQVQTTQPLMAEAPLSFESKEDILSMSYRPIARQNDRTVHNAQQVVLSDYSRLDAWANIRTLAMSDVQDILTDNTGGAIPPGSVRAVAATTAFVVEPLKVRTVSKGPAATYYITKLFQQSVHSSLRRRSAFRLVGRPASATDLLDLRHGVGPLADWVDEMEWFSGDYVASTDNLERGLSTAIMEFLVEDLDPEYREIFLNSLRPHYISYPSIEAPESFLPVFTTWLEKIGWKSKRDAASNGRKLVRPVKDDLGNIIPGRLMFTVPPCLQVNAQLMGSPSSFVVLCIANFALYMHSMRCWSADIGLDWSRKTRRYFARKVLINGDDLLAVMTAEAEIHFRRIGDRVGLSMSVGKTYRHRFYANINSTSYIADCRGTYCGDRDPEAERSDFDSSTPVAIPYLNTGLLLGQNKVLKSHDIDFGVDEQFGYSPLISILPRVLDGALPGRQCMLMADFLALHKDALRSEARGRNLFVSRSLGGWGVPVPETRYASDRWKFHITQRQLADVRDRLDRMLRPVVEQRPMGPEINNLDAARSLRPWSFDRPLDAPIVYLESGDVRVGKAKFDVTIEYCPADKYREPRGELPDQED